MKTVRANQISFAANGASRERRNQLTHPTYTKPEPLATAPNQVWSWDITKLKGPAKWTSVTAVLSCDDAPGLRVGMNAVGTDGFQSNLVFDVFPGAVYRIFVPGAEAGVQDTITATILDADDTIINASSVTLRFQ